MYIETRQSGWILWFDGEFVFASSNKRAFDDYVLNFKSERGLK